MTGPLSLSAGEGSPQRLHWSAYDKDDLERFGRLLSGFFGLEPFRAQKMWRRSIMQPLLHNQGPLPGSIKRIRDLMAKIVVKHR
jgi:hypothetical protein